MSPNHPPLFGELFKVLDRFAGCTDFREAAEALVRLLRTDIGCDAVAIRLADGPDYTYAAAAGLSSEFIEAENRLCLRDAMGEIARDLRGNPVLDCMCGSILQGRFDPALDHFTESGIFWTNSTTELLATTTEVERQGRTRNRCHGEGFESVGLFPLRYGQQTYGLIQLLDKKMGLFDPLVLARLERTARVVGLFLAEMKTTVDLESSNRRLVAILDSAGAAISQVGPDGRFTYVNARWQQMFGYTQDEVTGKPPSFITHPEDVNKGLVPLRRMLAGEIDSYRVDKRFFHKDGHRLWTELFVTAQRKPDGKLESCVGIVEDMSRRHELDEAYRSLVDNSLQGIAVMRDGEVVFANTAMETLTGFAVEELLKMTSEQLFGLVHPDERSEAVRRVEQRLRGEPLREAFEVRFHRKDGAQRWMGASAFEMTMGGGHPSVGMMLLDVTDEVEARERNITAKDTALREVLDQFQDAGTQVEQRVVDNVDRIVLPALRRLEPHVSSTGMIALRATRAGLEDITSAFPNRLSRPRYGLTVREIEVCGMVRTGLTNKEISDVLNLSVKTIETYRTRIRRKLGLMGTGANLAEHLAQLGE